MTLLSYIVIFYFGFRITSYLKTYSISFSAKTAQMHHSLNQVLFIQVRNNSGSFVKIIFTIFQALTPLFFLIAPTILINFCSFTRQTTTPDFMMCMILVAWPPFINAAFTLITLKPLRLRLIRMIRKLIRGTQVTESTDH